MNASASRITVVLPVFNGERYLGQAIDSVLQQTFPDFEFLIIDDGSEDSSVEIIRRYSDPRIRLLRHEGNRGLVATLNEGLSQARGDYIARMDADDVCRPNRLFLQVQWLDDHPDHAVVGSFVQRIDADGALLPDWIVDRKTATPEEIRRTLIKHNCLAHPTTMLRRSALNGLAYDPRARHAEDYELWLQVVSRDQKMAKIPVALLLYRIHSDSVTLKKARYLGRTQWIQLRAKLLFVGKRLRSRNWGRFETKLITYTIFTFPYLALRYLYRSARTSLTV